jgi:hypothetical protein
MHGYSSGVIDQLRLDCLYFLSFILLYSAIAIFRSTLLLVKVDINQDIKSITDDERSN